MSDTSPQTTVPAEEQLSGGNSGEVIRSGDTVRRETGPWTSAVHTWLEVLAEAGIAEVPRVDGIDDQGREVLSFVPGEVANYPLPDWLWSDQLLDEAGQLMRRLHDAGAELAQQSLTWRSPVRQPAETVCHNDFAPYNLVFDDGHLVGVIDFDYASPGPRIWDFAYLAYRLVAWGSDAGSAAPTGDLRWSRTERLIQAYGADWSVPEVLAVTMRRLEDLADFSEARAAQTGRTDFGDHAALYRADAATIEQEIAGR